MNYDRKKEIVRFSTQLRTIMSGTNALLFDCIFNHVFAASRFHLVYCSAGRGRHRAAPWFILAIINKRLRMLEILLSALLHFAVLFCYLVFGPRFGCVCVFCSLFLGCPFSLISGFRIFPFLSLLLLFLNTFFLVRRSSAKFPVTRKIPTLDYDNPQIKQRQLIESVQYPDILK